jgi:DNA-binding response OmpR family regulator
VLCVEDDRDTCDVLRFVMHEFDFHIAHTIAGAEEMIANRPFDIYVLDNWLPDGSGVDLCSRIRQNDAQAPIIFTSAIAQRHDINLAMDAGANSYLVKPYEPDNLLRNIKELLGRSVN